MGKVQRLSAELANQIAAGEVVERPASAVKELVENAIDAGARRIAVTIEFGGKKLIRVEDDGEGMTPDDVALALERHATSKLARLEDLGAIGTLGFRGEALPSIASVAHLVVRSRTHGAAVGTEVRVDGGVTSSLREVGAPEGTVLEITDLFYNVPARRKFLKSDKAESAQVSRIMTQMALGYPEVGFTLTSAGRRILECAPAGSLEARFFQLYGERADLVPVAKDAAGLRLRGYAAALVDRGPARGPQHIFVNRRAVKDRTIAHAITHAYSRATIKPRSPEVHLFLEVPVDRVDVNVHPTKAEVRFRDQSLVHEVIRRGLADALGEGGPPAFPLDRRTGRVPEGTTPSIPGIVSGLSAGSRWAPMTDAFSRTADAMPVEREMGLARERPDEAPETGAVAGAAPMIPLGQFRDTFIIAVDNEGIAIIDQHVAHERVLYEQVMERLTTGRLESQRVLEPHVVELPAGQREALAAHAGDLDRLGFEIGGFGGDSVRIAAVPTLLDRRESEQAVRALAGDLEGLDRSGGVDEALGRIAATTACHAAVKANDRLTFEKMTYILAELRRTAYSTICPHGRPVVLRLSRHEIENRFERI
jgi:DNA mismatch repair protein MutL